MRVVARRAFYVDADLGGISGHRQVTDTYLVALARHHGGSLATFDRALGAAHPDLVDLIGYQAMVVDNPPEQRSEFL